ncbi:MAG: L,D-transpeptidase [Luteolibacter sp.]
MRVLSPTILALSSVAIALVSTSCGVSGRHSIAHHENRILHQWHDDGGSGEVSIRISLSDQIAEFKRGDRDIGWCYVATGKEGHATTPGTYQITEKIEDKHSGSYGWIEDEFGNVTNGDATPGTPVPKGMVYVPAPMPFWMRITNYGIGMHGGLIPQPGEPASHGCIRMPKDFVATLYGVVEVGTPVTITREPAHHGPMEQNQPTVPNQPTPPRQFNGDYRVISSRPITDADLHKPRAVSRNSLSDPFTSY